MPHHARLSGRMSRYASRESPDVLIGWGPISRHCCVCERTVARWAKHHGFPACRLPDGRIMTSKSLIDHWIFARQLAEQDMIEELGDSDSKAESNDSEIPLRP